MSGSIGFAASSIRWLAPAMLLAGFIGCYGPLSLPEGAPCQQSEQCPKPQQCVLGSCLLRAPPVDGRPPAPDAMMLDAMTLDAPVDAMPLPCSTAGLSCGGTATMFTCGGNCWVKCTGAAVRATARLACAGWMGALGAIDDATEQSCVTPHVGTGIFAAALWIGAIQSDDATTQTTGWTWNGTTPVVYTSWATGEPNDADGVENGMEQCANIRPDGSWDDDDCSKPLGFFCERP